MDSLNDARSSEYWVGKPSLREAQVQGLVPWDDLEMDLNGVRVFRDRFPVAPGHLLFVPEYDEPRYIAMAFKMAKMRGDIMVQRGQCDGYNLGMNIGSAAGQTVMYPHVHLIPRRSGDHPDPVGGVRAVIPGQANYRKPDYKNPIDK